MSRTGFDQKKHPYQLQLRICSFLDIEGIQNKSSVTINFEEGRITNYHTDDAQISTTIREYIASDDELKELYSFFTLDELEKFEAMPEHEKSQYETGYYDCAYLRYFLIGEGNHVSDGMRSRIYRNDPIDMALKWIRKTTTFNQGI